MRSKKRTQFTFAADVKSIFLEAIRQYKNREEISATIRKRIYEQEDYRKITTRGREFIYGNIHAWYEAMYSHVEWRSRLDGKLVTKDAIPTGRWPDVRPGAFVYRSNPEKIYDDAHTTNENPIGEIARHMAFNKGESSTTSA